MRRKQRLLLLFVLLMTAATGAWAQSATTTYTVNLNDGTEDNPMTWTGKVGEATTFSALPLEGVAAGQKVTLKYGGTRKVKSITATLEAPVPEGAIKGKFTVNADGKQVHFAKGNLQATYYDADWSDGTPGTWTWAFAANQWDYIGGAEYNTSTTEWSGTKTGNNFINGDGKMSENGTVDLFGWSTYGTKYGIHNSENILDYSDEFVDWGRTIGTGWRTLSKDEWNYLFFTRESGSKVNGIDPSPTNARYTHATINTDNGTNGIHGMILFPDGVTIDGSKVSSWGNINGASTWDAVTKCTTSQWNALAAKGFVFLPTGGIRLATSVTRPDVEGYYWSSDTDPSNSCNSYFIPVIGPLAPITKDDSRRCGFSVRLVYDIE